MPTVLKSWDEGKEGALAEMARVRAEAAGTAVTTEEPAVEEAVEEVVEEAVEAEEATEEPDRVHRPEFIEYFP